MSGRSPPDGPEPKAPATGDLFAHFGVQEQEPSDAEWSAVAAAIACTGCGWYITSADTQLCPQCGVTPTT